MFRTSLVRFLFCLLLMMITYHGADGNGKPITCQAGTFAVGEPATVSCNLQHVRNAQGSSVNMVRHRPGAPPFDPGKSVLVCTWLNEEQRHQCRVVDDGYVFYNNSHTPVAVNIPAVTYKAEGLYACFLVPPNTTDSHACDLIIREGQAGQTVSQQPSTRPGTDLQNAKGGDSETWIVCFIVAVVFAVVFLAILVTSLILMRRHLNKLRSQKDDHNETMKLLSVESGREDTGEPDLNLAEAYSNKAIAQRLKPFMMGKEQIKEVMDTMKGDLDARVHEDRSHQKCLFPGPVKPFPALGREKYDILVVQVGSRWLKITDFKQQGNEITTVQSVSYKIPKEIRLGTFEKDAISIVTRQMRSQGSPPPPQSLLDFIVSRVSTFIGIKELTKIKMSVAFVFSYPCKYDERHDLTSARIVKWTKGFHCDDMLDKNLEKMLQQKFKKDDTLSNLEIKAVVNDSTGVVISGVRQDPNCTIAVVLGYGFTACYLKEESDTTTMIIDTELGALGEDGKLDRYRASVDFTLDEDCANSHTQILEKMVSRLYLGDVVRLLLLELIQSGNLFSPVYGKHTVFDERHGITTEHIWQIESDNSGDHHITKCLLDQLQVEHYDDEDCKVVKHVCRVVTERAACLVAAALAALIQHVGQKELTVAFDASVYRFHHRFQKLVEAKIQELVGDEYHVKFLPIKNATGIGAALMTAVLMSSEENHH